MSESRNNRTCQLLYRMGSYVKGAPLQWCHFQSIGQ